MRFEDYIDYLELLTEPRLVDMETRLASRYDLLQKLDDALASQQRQILELEGKLRLMATQMRVLEPDKGSAPQDERPPHY